MERYINKLLAYIEKNNKYSTIPNLLIRSEKKTILIVTQSMKKIKGLDNFVIVEEACMITLEDFWLTKNKKDNVVTKAHLKKVTGAKKKAKEKKDQVKKKAKSKDQRLD